MLDWCVLGVLHISEVNFAQFFDKKDDFLVTTVITSFDENSLNQFYIHLCVQIFNHFFVFLFKSLLKYLLINTYKKYLPRTLMYMRTKMPMMAV